MENRSFWTQKISNELKEFNVVWLFGVRRTGKTTLCHSMKPDLYLDCELPRNRRRLADPEDFFKDYVGKLVVLDEIHRLTNPSEVLKIAADHFPKTKVIATGSSTFAAKEKFSDTLTDRKGEVFLTPLNFNDLETFRASNFEARLLRGGLPKNYLSKRLGARSFRDWVDSYWAKDIQELFRIERRSAFMKLMELIFLQSGGLFEASAFSAPCEISRQTVVNYLEVLRVTNVCYVLRPFSRHSNQEVISAPKVYGFDTGFVCYFKGWEELREDDYGPLWEHLVLNELMSHFHRDDIHYWRNKNKREVDFVLTPGRKQNAIAIECKWKERDINFENLFSFRALYPEGKNVVVVSDITKPFKKRVKGLEIEVISLKDIADL